VEGAGDSKVLSLITDGKGASLLMSPTLLIVAFYQVTRSEGEGGVEAKVELSLITDGSGAGRGGVKQADALPPLMPGLPARRGGQE